MNRILLNQKTISERKEVRKIQKTAIRTYGRGKAVLKNKLGKIVTFSGVEEKNKLQANAIHRLDAFELLKLLQENKLTGMSGSGFLVEKKIEKIMQKNSPKILLVNGAECEPGLIHDRWLLENCRKEIVGGIQILQQAFSFDRCILAYSMDREEQRSRRKKAPEKYEVCHVPAKYPMGEEHYLIKQVLGVDIPKEEPPVEHGILVLNVQTIWQIYNVVAGVYEKGRYMTAANLNTGEARVIYVANGENIKQKLKNIYPQEAGKTCFAGGGVMYAHEISDEDVFTEQICFAAVGSPAEITNSNSCKGCGKCNRKCPAGVDIREIVRRREKNPNADISGLGLENCVHCGSCTFFCRAGKDTMAYFEE